MEMKPKDNKTNQNELKWNFTRGSNFLMEIQFWTTYITFTMNCIWTMDFTLDPLVNFAFEDIYLLTVNLLFKFLKYGLRLPFWY